MPKSLALYICSVIIVVGVLAGVIYGTTRLNNPKPETTLDQVFDDEVKEQLTFRLFENLKPATSETTRTVLKASE